MHEVMKRVARFAESDAPVAIFGKTGTGKEVIARTLHANSSRAAHPFVALNVAALPGDLLESELFGHARGAFTGANTQRRGLFEAAHGGTLFLDEIGEMPLGLQAKLLRTLQDGEVRRVGETSAFGVDVRVVSATHRDLASQVREGLFREDLLYRLRVLSLALPELSDRKADILPLALQFLSGERTPATGFTHAATEALLHYPWRGNVRELQNFVKHGAALARGELIDVEDFPHDINEARPAEIVDAPAMRGCEHPTLANVEREHILRVLDACNGSQSEAARTLGIGRNTLWRKLQTMNGNGRRPRTDS